METGGDGGAPIEHLIASMVTAIVADLAGKVPESPARYNMRVIRMKVGGRSPWRIGGSTSKDTGILGRRIEGQGKGGLHLSKRYTVTWLIAGLIAQSERGAMKSAIDTMQKECTF